MVLEFPISQAISLHRITPKTIDSPLQGGLF
jgi:hypothetical protein